MGAVHGDALRFVDGRGVTVVDMGVVLGVKCDTAAIVKQHGHALRA